MLEKFKLLFNSLSPADKKAALKYIFEASGIQAVNEGFFTGPATTIEKGLFTGPIVNSKKCEYCGK